MDLVGELLSEDDFQSLRGALSTNTVSCWAMTSTLEKNFARMRSGDLVLLTPKGTGQFHYRGAVLHKVRHPELGERLWTFTPRKPWTLIYFLDNVARVAIPKQRLLFELGYQGWRNDAVQRARFVRPELLEAALKKHGSIDQLLAAAMLDGPAFPAKPEVPSASLRPDWLRPLIQEIEALRRDSKHLERAHEALVESLFQMLGFERFVEIRFREGRVDVRLEVDGSTLAVAEVKRDWSLSRHDKAVVEQAYRYAQETGARYVVVSNGDYYAWFDLRKGLGYDQQFTGDFVLSQLSSENVEFLEGLRREALLGSAN